LAIGIGALVSLVNPMAGIAVAKAVGLTVGVLEVVKNDSNQ
jgi:hypothetical protein